MSTDDNSDEQYETTRRNAMKMGGGAVFVPLNHQDQSAWDKVKSFFGQDSDKAGAGENVYLKVNDEIVTKDTKTLHLKGYGVGDAVEKNKHEDEGVAIVNLDVDGEDISPRSSSPDSVTTTLDTDGETAKTVNLNGSSSKGVAREDVPSESGIAKYAVTYNAGTFNTVTEVNQHTGYNAETRGSRFDTSEPSAHWTIEPKYDDGSTVWVEMHEQGLYPDGTKWRLREDQISRDGTKKLHRRYMLDNLQLANQQKDGPTNRVKFDMVNDRTRFLDGHELWLEADSSDADVSSSNPGSFKHRVAGDAKSEYHAVRHTSNNGIIYVMRPSNQSPGFELRTDLGLNGNSLLDVRSSSTALAAADLSGGEIALDEANGRIVWKDASGSAYYVGGTAL